MADVEKMTATIPTDIPVSSPNLSETGGASSSTAELGTSPTQEPSSNSHPHDSEYDTASDLEGGEDYDDESSSDEESETDDDDAGSETDEDEDELGSGTVSGMERNAAEIEAQKKVDEDRSNPQYIPKRGTFYEHDDRTAETEGDCVVETGSDSGQCAVEPSISDVGNGVIATGAPPGGQTPTISQASKTMKKWQPASGGDRWSHDRFEATEQAPKSRAELLQTYGYDIRNEDAAPRARRRRRYGRGPSKYSRNWEDEQAYLKASNKERKPPRPQDFPALNERSSTSNSSSSKMRQPRSSISRDEKENRSDRRSIGGNEKQLGGAPSAAGGSVPLPAKSQESREREPKNRNYGRANGAHNNAGSRQHPKDARQMLARSSQMRHVNRDYVDPREQQDYQQKPAAAAAANRANGMSKQLNDVQQQQQQQQQQRQPPQQQQLQPQQQQQQQQQQPQQQQQKHMSSPLVSSNLSQRLQQVQQRNDPSHVGSVQMHALATQNQQQQQLQLQQQQQQQQPPPQLAAEQRNGPKRYSSLRRTQHEANQQQQQQQQQQHLAEQQLQQQLQLQQQSQLMLQDPHMLMQIAYQQQELQAQLQTLQLGAATPTAVSTAQGKHATATAAYPQAQAAPYYVTAAESVPVSVPVPQAPYVNPSNAGYLPPPPAAVAYAQPTTAATQQQQQLQPQQQQQTQPAAPGNPGTAPPAQNYHQNYNTVGGTTYFVPPAQTNTRPAVLPQRRPNNAIPILPPSEKHKSRLVGNANANANANPKSEEVSGSSDNIDHIIDNMFVQRPAFQPPPASSGSSSTAAAGETTSGEDANSNTTGEQTHQGIAVPGQE